MIFTLSALLLGAMQTAEAVPIEPRWDGTTCSTSLDGDVVPADALAAEVKRWAQHGRPIAVISGGEIPYRCIGSTIFALQAAGYRLSGNWLPPKYSVLMRTTVVFTVMPNSCAYRVNDEPIAESALAILMDDWKRYDTQVHLKPHPNAEYRCVEAAIKQVRRAGITNLGFTGNDQDAPEPEVAPR